MPAPLSSAEVARAVREVYAELDTRPIERQCSRLGECCHFKLTGRTPFLTKAEAVLAATAYRATGRTRWAPAAAGACPLLDARSGNCLIYPDRPFGCRTHFCSAAGGPYPRRHVADLIHRLEDLSAPLGGREAQPLPSALPAALAELR